jgi:hypothetical protein
MQRPWCRHVLVMEYLQGPTLVDGVKASYAALAKRLGRQHPPTLRSCGNTSTVSIMGFSTGARLRGTCRPLAELEREHKAQIESGALRLRMYARPSLVAPLGLVPARDSG